MNDIKLKQVQETHIIEIPMADYTWKLVSAELDENGVIFDDSGEETYNARMMDGAVLRIKLRRQ